MKERSYLIEVLPEDSKNNGFLENTLTKVFCATFNNSEEFKKIICKLVGIRKTSFDKIYAENQNYLKKDNERVILDICIYEDTREFDKKMPLCIIENKTEDELTEEQLKKQNKIFNEIYPECKNIPKVAIVKYFSGDIPEPWKVLRWQSDIYDSLSGDDILIQEFKNFLEVMKMTVPVDLTRQEIKNIEKFLYDIKEIKTPITLKDRSIFNYFQKYYDILNYCVERLQENEMFKKKIEKNFRFNPIINTWWEGDKEKVDLFIGSYIDFNKELSLEESEEKIDGIDIGIFFKDKKPFVFKVIFIKKDGNSRSYIKDEIISEDKLFRKDKHSKNDVVDHASLCKEIQKIIDKNI